MTLLRDKKFLLEDTLKQVRGLIFFNWQILKMFLLKKSIFLFHPGKVSLKVSIERPR